MHKIFFKYNIIVKYYDNISIKMYYKIFIDLFYVLYEIINNFNFTLKLMIMYVMPSVYHVFIKYILGIT